MSFELPAYFAETWQPVAFSNGVTHCFSVYPSQATSVSLPSPAPTDVGTRRALRDARRRNGEGGHERRERDVSEANPLHVLSSSITNSTSGLQRSRTRFLSIPWTSCDDVSRFCCTTANSPPPSSATMNFVTGPR